MEILLTAFLVFLGLLVIAVIFYLLVTISLTIIFGIKWSETFRFIMRGMRR